MSNTGLRLNPASVEVSAAAEQQHYEDDDEQRVCVHVLSRVWRARPSSLYPLNARDEQRDSAPRVTGLRQLQPAG